jgi:adenylate cyclase
MFERLRLQQIPLAAGLVAITAMLALAALLPKSWRDGVRENAFDFVLAADRWLYPAGAGPQGPRVVVVDIDRRSLEAVGPWPWPRAVIARLLETTAAAKPVAAAVDVLFTEQDSRSGALLRRRPGALGGGEAVAPIGVAGDGDERPPWRGQVDAKR